jgi:hypothetical protein
MSACAAGGRQPSTTVSIADRTASEANKKEAIIISFLLCVCVAFTFDSGDHFCSEN